MKSQSPLLAALLGKRSEESSCPCVTERDNESGVCRQPSLGKTFIQSRGTLSEFSWQLWTSVPGSVGYR